MEYLSELEIVSLCGGRQPHRMDWRREYLPPVDDGGLPWRPLLHREPIQAGDQWLDQEWHVCSLPGTCESFLQHHRTRRPLPAEEKPAETCPYCGKEGHNEDAVAYPKRHADAERYASGSVPTDPKQMALSANPKPPMHLLPSVFEEETAKALGCGSRKYGEYNWRFGKVEMLTYLGAMRRHIAALIDGEDIDPESGAHHLGHVAAGCAIVLDALKHGTLIDNRPPSTPCPNHPSP